MVRACGWGLLDCCAFVSSPGATMRARQAANACRCPATPQPFEDGRVLRVPPDPRSDRAHDPRRSLSQSLPAARCGDCRARLPSRACPRPRQH